jgi:hypothetical protein
MGSATMRVKTFSKSISFQANASARGGVLEEYAAQGSAAFNAEDDDFQKVR